LANYLASARQAKPPVSHVEFKSVEREIAERTRKLLSINGKRTVTSFHRELGKLLWDKCGMARNAGALRNLLKAIPALREEIWKNVKVTGESGSLNQDLEAAGRVADFMEFGELMARDALMRNESCGGHFREEFQTSDGEALRDDANYSFVAAWQYQGEGKEPVLHKEPLHYEEVHMATRVYK